MTARDRDESFLARWSRLKRGGEAGEETPTAPPARGTEDRAATEPPAPDVPAGDAAAGDGATEVARDLPDPETLDATADFRVFLREGVPEELQRRALRRLWRLNPIISAVDPLVDYGEDFTDAATVVADMKTLYEVGRGMVDRAAEEEVAARPEAGDGAGAAATAGSEEVGASEESDGSTERSA